MTKMERRSLGASFYMCRMGKYALEEGFIILTKYRELNIEK